MLEDYKYDCLFGEHLIHWYPNNPVAIVEAPKTALVCTLYWGLPKDDKSPVFMSCFSKSGLTSKRLKPLKGRKVILYPDVDGIDFWEAKIPYLKRECGISEMVVSNSMKRMAKINPDSKMDIADYILKTL